jgi:hypothetical protein
VNISTILVELSRIRNRLEFKGKRDKLFPKDMINTGERMMVQRIVKKDRLPLNPVIPVGRNRMANQDC